MLTVCIVILCAICNGTPFLTGGGGYQAIYRNSYFRGEPIPLSLRAEDGVRALRLELFFRRRWGLL